jgi:hypothetical protein
MEQAQERKMKQWEAEAAEAEAKAKAKAEAEGKTYRKLERKGSALKFDEQGEQLVRVDKVQNMDTEWFVEELEADIACFLCPITRDVMQDPYVTVANGESFERANIEAWIRAGGAQHAPDPALSKFVRTRTIIRSPVTLQELSSVGIIPNHALRNTIVDSLQKIPELRHRYRSLGSADADVQEAAVLPDARGGNSTVACVACFEDRTGRCLAVAGMMNEVKVWEIRRDPSSGESDAMPAARRAVKVPMSRISESRT